MCDGEAADAGVTDAGRVVDAGLIDASRPAQADAATPDGATDSGAGESGTPDAGVAPDASGPSDGGASRFAVRIPTDSARVLVSDVGGDLYPSTFTYEAWVNFDRLIPGLSQDIFVAATSMGALILRIDTSDNLSCSIEVADIYGVQRAQIMNASVQVTAGTWHHLACTHDDAGTLALYIDGIQRASTLHGPVTLRLPPAGTTLGVGQNASPLPTGMNFQGMIDEVRISNAVVYTGAPFTPERHPTVESSTVALFHFDEGSGTTATDAVGPGRHAATLDMGATWVPE